MCTPRVYSYLQHNPAEPKKGGNHQGHVVKHVIKRHAIGFKLGVQGETANAEEKGDPDLKLRAVAKEDQGRPCEWWCVVSWFRIRRRGERSMFVYD